VQGRYDAVCPIVSAHELVAAWPEVAYHVIPDAGHSVWEPGVCAAVIAACEGFKRRLA
jgi:proline iminopeptidase